MDRKSKGKKCNNEKKKWEKPDIKKCNLQDVDSSAFEEILLGPNDPGVSKG